MQPPLLARVAQGDPEAIRECVDRYGGLLWALARKSSPSQAEAEDAVQEIFVELWRNAARYDESRGSEISFIGTLARRRLIDRRRARMRRGETSIDLAPAASIPPSQELASDARRVAWALEQLRPEQRNLLVLSAYQGLTHEEIAQSTGLPLGTVKATVRRGLIRVRELLAPSPSAVPPSGVSP